MLLRQDVCDIRPMKREISIERQGSFQADP